MQKLYIIDYENAHWCGGQLHCVVRADSAEDAEDRAEQHMQETQYELFRDEYDDIEEGETYDESSYVVNSIKVLDENNEHWKFYQDPVQRANFYPEV
jgi:hypothetical protein